MYTPRPIDTGSVQLPPALLELTERLAEHNHDIWAQRRFKEGWTYGPQRDDAKKQHPCLVPYAELPDSEKQYDRETALQTLRAIVALGYQIEPPPSDTCTKQGLTDQVANLTGSGPPRVVLFVGHMIDRPDRAVPRFPPQLEDAVREAIHARLKALDGRVGFGSAACGADILFHEAIHASSGESHVVLSCQPSQFVQDCIDIGHGPSWRQRFDAVLQRAAQVTIASDQRIGGAGVFYDYASLLIEGLAAARARELGTEVVALALWDGHSGSDPGGTANVLRRWQSHGVDVQIIDLATLLHDQAPLPAPSPIPSAAPAPRTARVDVDCSLMALLFADAVGYGKLNEIQVLAFGQRFLAAVADLIKGLPLGPVERQTRGDGLYLVFPSLREAGVFALDLCDLASHTDWTKFDLPAEMSMRIALHAGPVVRYRDPITGQLTYTGNHVTRAARIEPITPAGQVYASQGFAALAAVEKISEFTCDFVRQAQWAKEYGAFPTYVVRRS